MLAKETILNTLKSFNINSQKYEPTIYEKDNEIGICLDFKDSIFGYLTRLFTFNDTNELKNFLTEYYWYKDNKNKYLLNLSLDTYNTKKPKLIYTFQNKILNLKDMLNIDQLITNENNEQNEEIKKSYYLDCIKDLTNYLINFKQLKENNKVEKNKLKALENDLKYALLEQLIIYYGRNKTLDKKPISLDAISDTDNSLLIENLKNIQNKDINEITDYLKSLINIIKEEELDEKNLINIYSINIYKYNINILNKQIEFVKSKINAEKNFNLKGSKIHNIDEELKSFLKTNIAPTKIEVFLNDNKNKIIEKFNNITNLDNACFIITGKKINKPIIIEKKNIDVYQELNNQFFALNKETKNNLILYNSIYKPICNYIINNNYPEINDIIKAFDFNYYYEELQEVIFDENNSHYLVNYFSNINFNNLNSYISSIINISKDIENINFNLSKEIYLFTINTNNLYKQLSPLYNKNSKYLVKTNHPIIFIPYKIIIDFETKEININKEYNFYTKENIIEELETIVLNKYIKNNIKKDDIIITDDLILNEEYIFNKAHLEGETHE